MSIIKIEKKIIRDKKGFSMLEMIVVLSIFSIGILGIASLMLQAMQAESVSAGYLKASMLAQEGIEIVRGYRDDNWLDQTIPSWDKNFGDGDGTFIVDYNHFPDYTPNNIGDSGTILGLDANGFYKHGIGTTPTNFRRLITISDCNPVSPDCWQVESLVSWTASGRGNEYKANTILYNWR